ncbi:MAG: methyltransferase family protein [Flavobacteriales bacterium]
MDPLIHDLLRFLWIVMIAYWTISALRAKKVAAQEPLPLRILAYWLPLVIAVYLLGPGEWFGHTLIRENFVEHTNTVGVIGLILAAAGAVLAIWSRYLLGRNWSVSVQKKQDHELISKGPYKFVRHPIYSGLLLLFTGNALIVGDYRAIIAVLIVFLSFWYKLRKEERWMTEAFGEAYVEYAKGTRALVPGIL